MPRLVPFHMPGIAYFLRCFFLLWLLLGSTGFLFSQTKVKTIEILGADSWEYDERLVKGTQRLIGNVRLKHENTFMDCDSAYIYPSNSMDAFGHIHIRQGDSVNVYGDTLKYNANTRMAELKHNVRMTDKDMVLTTDFLFFDVAKSIGSYTTGAKIVNKENILTSVLGYYFSASKELLFKKQVVLTNPKYVMNSDTMRYRTNSRTAYFLGPSTIKGDSNFIYCENGFYNTEKEVSRFSRNAYLTSKSQILKGDSLFYDRKNGIGIGYKRVSIFDTAQQILIVGQYAFMNELKEKSFVTDRAMLIKIQDKDSIFMHADTLRAEKAAVQGTEEKKGQAADKIFFAYRKVQFYGKDVQGRCDSLVYTSSDSTMRMFGTPVLWSEKHQLTAEKLELVTGSKKLKTVHLTTNAFATSQEDSLKFNQVKGKKMDGVFVDNKIYKIKVDGNGESVYYAKDDKKLIGVNKAECSNMLIYMKDGKIGTISFLAKPTSVLFPKKEATPAELLLKDFSWKVDIRPLRKEDIFIWKDQPGKVIPGK
jgi:lipopolysaccharide export system protein LptA